jgi:hypothetical protein
VVAAGQTQLAMVVLAAQEDLVLVAVVVEHRRMATLAQAAMVATDL